MLSPKQLAIAIGVSESSLKRWADEGLVEVSRTAGGHRRIALPEAIRFIRQSKATVVRPDMLGFKELAQMSHSLDPSDISTDYRQLYDALEQGHGEMVRGFLLSWYLSGRSLAALFDGPLKRTFHELGEKWRHGEEGIFIEHHATDLCIQALNQLRSNFITPPESAPLAVGGAPSGDPYIIPSLLAAIVLAEQGFRTINLGPNTPRSTLQVAIESYQPALVWISITAEQEENAIARGIREITGWLADYGGNLVIGGQKSPDINTSTSAHAQRIETMAELSAFAKGLFVSSRSN